MQEKGCHAVGPGQDWKMGTWEPEDQQDPEQSAQFSSSPTPWSGTPQASVETEKCMESSPVEKYMGVLVDKRWM